jgi:hypothetical protein
MGSTFDQEFDQFEDLVEEAKKRFPGFQLSERIFDTVQSIIGDVQHGDESDRQAVFRLRGIKRMLAQSQRSFFRNSPKFFDGALRRLKPDADVASPVMDAVDKIEDFCVENTGDFDLETASGIYRVAVYELQEAQTKHQRRKAGKKVRHLAAMSERDARQRRAISDRAV